MLVNNLDHPSPIVVDLIDLLLLCLTAKHLFATFSSPGGRSTLRLDETNMAVPSSTYSLSHAVSTFDPAFRQLGLETITSTDSSIEGGKRYDHDHDILIYGATSFTGKLVVKYLLQHPQYTSGEFSFALGGRTKSKLDDLAEQVEAEGHTRPAVVCFSLETGEEDGVRKAVERCKVVVNLAGPFSTQNAEVLIRCVNVLFVGAISMSS
jgi:hypothetical protein